MRQSLAVGAMFWVSNSDKDGSILNSNMADHSKDLCCVPISILSALTRLSLSTLGVPIQIGQKEVYWKDPDGVLKTVKLRSVDRCTLFVLNGSHFSCVAEEAAAGFANVGTFTT